MFSITVADCQKIYIATSPEYILVVYKTLKALPSMALSKTCTPRLGCRLQVLRRCLYRENILVVYLIHVKEQMNWKDIPKDVILTSSFEKKVVSLRN